MTSIAIIEAVNTTAVQFHGQPIITTMVAGVAYVAMRPIVENIGIDWAGQTVKLRNQKDKFNCCDIAMVASDNKIRDFLCIPLRKLNGWLFSINPERVRADIKDKLIQYQEECFAVLHEYWTKGLVVNPRKATKKALPGKITIEQQEAVKQLVMNRGKALPKENQAKAIITMWSALKTHFGCSYKEINEDQFTEALSLAARVTIEGEFLGKQEALPAPKISYPMSFFDSYKWMVGDKELSDPWIYPANLLTPDPDYPNPCRLLLEEMKSAGYEVDAALFQLLSLQHHVQMLRRTVAAVERAVNGK